MVVAVNNCSWLSAVSLPWHHQGDVFPLKCHPNSSLIPPRGEEKISQIQFCFQAPSSKNPTLMQLPTWEWIAPVYECNPLYIRWHKAIPPPFNPFLVKLLQNTQNTALCNAAAYSDLLFSSTVCGGAALGSSCCPGKDNLLCPAHALEWAGHGAALPQLSRMLWAFSRDIPGLQGQKEMAPEAHEQQTLHLSRAMDWHGFSRPFPTSS